MTKSQYPYASSLHCTLLYVDNGELVIYLWLQNVSNCRILYVVMKIKQTLKQIMVGAFLVAGLTVATTSMTSAATVACTPGAAQSCCGGVKTAIIQCKETGIGTTEDTGLWGILKGAIKFLSIGVGIAAVGGIVYAAILYTSAGGNAEQVKKAMGMITNTVIGVIAYALMFSLLNFLIPGGLFR